MFTLSFFDRILLFVFLNLFFERFFYVYFQIMGNEQNPIQNVGKFFSNIFFVTFNIRLYLLWIFPLKMFQNFGGFES